MARHSSTDSSSSIVDVETSSSATASSAIQSHPSSLSDDMLAEIILRLPIDAIARSKCVSKSWRAAVSDDDFLRRRLPLHLSVLYFPSSSSSGDGKAASRRPRFACADDDAGMMMLRDRDLGGFLPLLDDDGSVVVCDASNGLLLLRAAGTGRRFYVVDPVTRRWAALPPPSEDPRLSILAFDPSSSSSSSSGGCGGYHVVNFTGRWRDHGGEVEVYSSEARAWAVRDADFGGVPAGSLSGSAVHFHAGALYFLASDPDCVVRMDLTSAAAAASGGGTGLECAVAELPEPADGGGEGRLAHSAGRLHYVATDAGLRLKVWVLDGEAPAALRWRLKHAVKLDGDVVAEEGSEARFMALHPEKDAVYVWSSSSAAVGKKKKLQQLLEYDLKRKEVTGAWAFGDGDGGEENRVVKTWLVPSAMYLSDCLSLAPDAHVQEQ